MGRLYSGNLNDFRAACSRLYQLDLAVIINEYSAHNTYKYVMVVNIEDRSGESIIQQRFEDYDADCLYNAATSWLNKQYNDLKSWS